MREPPHQVIKMVNFLIVEHPSVYNVILGRPALIMFLAITLTYHLMVKFPIEEGVGVLRVDHEESRKCYAIALRGRMDKHDNLQSMLDPRGKKLSKKVRQYKNQTLSNYIKEIKVCALELANC